MAKISHAEAVSNIANLFTRMGATIRNQEEIDNNLKREKATEQNTILDKIDPRIKAIAEQVVNTSIIEPDRLTKNCKDETCQIVTCSPDLFEKNLPEGITLDIIKQIEDYNDIFRYGVILGTGLLFKDMHDKDNSITDCTSFTERYKAAVLRTDIHLVNKEHRTEIAKLMDEQEVPLDIASTNVYDFINPRQVNHNNQLVRDHLQSLFFKSMSED